MALIDYFDRMTDRISLRFTARQLERARRTLSFENAYTAFAQILAREEDRWFAWAVVAFGSGTAAYFALNSEPSVTVFAGAMVVSLICFVVRRKIPAVAISFLLLLGACAALGFADGKLRTRIVAAPVLTRELGPIRVSGRVEDVEMRAPDRARIVLSVSRLAGHASYPAYVRLTVSGARTIAALAPGTEISALTRLNPPPEPALPRGYDFGRWAWFQQIGAVGFVYGEPRILAAARPGLLERLNNRLDGLRLSMTDRIEKAIPGPDGTIAAALITGERGEIDPEDNQAYRDSGLAHVLSISGVHLALAGLGVFWVLRALLALWPRIALTQPIKKWAAIGALAGSTFYLAISGGGAPANRSWLMLSMMLLGVMLDRPALSMRSVAMAALVILVFQPENIIDPSFQMSFGAVIGLIALAEWQSARHAGLPAPASRIGRLWRKSRKYVLGALSVSLVATLATTPIAIYHFDRAAAYSLIANLLAEPVVAFVVMPAAAVAVIVMPFRLEVLPLHVMGWGVHTMSAIAHWVATLPGATAMVRSWPAAALVIMILGGLWIALWRQSWRWFGTVPVAASILMIMANTPPDILIARDLRAAAIRGEDGRLVIVGVNPDGYTASQWLIKDGDRRDVQAARTPSRCDELSCVALGKGGRVLALPVRVSALPDDCAQARIVISTLPLHVVCHGRELLVDKSDIERNGAMAITFRANRSVVETVHADRGTRPWSALNSGE